MYSVACIGPGDRTYFTGGFGEMSTLVNRTTSPLWSPGHSSRKLSPGTFSSGGGGELDQLSRGMDSPSSRKAKLSIRAVSSVELKTCSSSVLLRRSTTPPSTTPARRRKVTTAGSVDSFIMDGSMRHRHGICFSRRQTGN